ncbi:MAG: hypothetical protein ABI970_08570 [Chloroflexota bacterium]
MTISEIANLIIALSTAGSWLYISRQVNVARLQAKGQFLLALDSQFEKYADLTIRLLTEQHFDPQGKDWPEIFGLMSVFERINIMVDDKILDIGLVDRLYGFRLIGILANEGIYQRLLATGAEWQDFIDLCYEIAKHRGQGMVDATANAFIERVQTLNKDALTVANPFQF